MRDGGDGVGSLIGQKLIHHLCPCDRLIVSLRTNRPSPNIPDPVIFQRQFNTSLYAVTVERSRPRDRTGRERTLHTNLLQVNAAVCIISESDRGFYAMHFPLATPKNPGSNLLSPRVMPLRGSHPLHRVKPR